MHNEMWAKMHGATVHFPIALILCSGALDASGFFFPDLALRRGLHAAGYWTTVLGALGTVPAVVSGLVMSKGVMLGHDAMRFHHLFVWPAFALIVGLAIWRVLAGDFAASKAPVGYLATVGLAAILILGAGYWGGEMMLALETPTPSSPALIAQGRVLFLASCAHCHGADATGDEGPDLHNVRVSDRYISNIITRGIKSEMPSFRKKLGKDEIMRLTAYVRSLH